MEISEAHSAALAARVEYWLPEDDESRIEIMWYLILSLPAVTNLAREALVVDSKFSQIGHWKSS